MGHSGICSGCYVPGVVVYTPRARKSQADFYNDLRNYCYKDLGVSGVFLGHTWRVATTPHETKREKMPLTTREEIKKRILDEMEHIKEAPYAIDYIEEMADSECPVYYNQIIAEWTELTPDDSNEFGEIMTPKAETTIYDLMSADLWLYYKREFLSVYNEILDEQEQAGE